MDTYDLQAAATEPICKVAILQSPSNYKNFPDTSS